MSGPEPPGHRDRAFLGRRRGGDAVDAPLALALGFGLADPLYLRKAFRIYPEYFTEEDKSAMRSIKYLSPQDFLSSQGENLQELKKIIDHGSINS